MPVSTATKFALDAAGECLKRHFKVLALDGYGLEDKPALVSAAGALLYYVGTTLHHSLGHVRKVQLRQADDVLVLDGGTIRHLQLLPGGEVTREASLLGVLDVTKTPMGARTMRNWIARPLARATDVNARLDAVQAFVENRGALASLRTLLSGVRDLERLIQKVDAFRANPRDVKALAASLRPIPEIKGHLTAAASSLNTQHSSLIVQMELVDLIDKSICEDPAVMLADGGFIAPGYDADLVLLDSDFSVLHTWVAGTAVR